MPVTVLKKKRQHHGSLLLRKGVAVPLRKSGGDFAFENGEPAAPPTPVPSWKLYENPSYQSLSIAAAAGTMASITGLMEPEDDGEEENMEEEEEKIWVQRNGIKEEGPEDTAAGSAPCVRATSARKLAASLWEELQEDGQGDSYSTVCDFSEPSPRSHLQRRPSSLSTSESPDSVKHYQHSSKVPTTSQHIFRNCQRPPALSPPLKAIMLMQPSAAGISSGLRISASEVLDSTAKDAREEGDEAPNQYECADIASPCVYIKTSCRSQALERTQVDTSYLGPSFSEDLKRALWKVQQAEAAQISAHKEVDGLLRRCADEILMLRTKEQEKIQAAVLSIAEQLDKERKAKRNVETENRRLACNLADANKAALAAKEELEKERKARQLMEEVCDELAKEIGEDKAEAEELKRELAKVRAEIEEERKTFQVTEAWREERVQMKLSEAKLELEERCVALDKLKMELEMFLKRGNAHVVEACLDHVGETLRGAVRKLQEETSKSVFYQKDARGLLPRNNDAISSDNPCSWENPWSSKEDQLIMHVNLYDSDGIQQTLFAAEGSQKEFGRNVQSDRFSMEECNLPVSTKTHLDEHDKQWISCMHRYRNEPGMKFYARGLNSLDDRGLGEDSFNKMEHNTADSDGSGIGGDYSSECGFSYKEQGNWSADLDNEIGHLRQRDIALCSASDVEEESIRSFSPKFSRKVTNTSLEKMNVKRRHGAARVEERHGGKGRTKGEQCYDRDNRRKSVFSQTKHHTRLAEGDKGFLSLAGYSPVYKGHMPTPDVLAQEGTNWKKHNVWSGRDTVYNSVDWAEPFKKNSLQAKLLLEDRLSAGNLKLKH